MTLYLHTKNLITKIRNVLLVIISTFFVVFFTVKFLDLIKYKCIYKKFFNITCAGCGTTRMFKALFKMEFYQAFRYNPLFFIYFFLLLIYFLIIIFSYIKKNLIFLPSFKIIMFFVITTLIFMILRNIDYFSYLLPTKIN